MERNLIEIDRVYKRMHQFATAEDRIKYCTILLQRTESYLKSTGLLTDHMAVTSRAIIDAVRKELGVLDKTTN